MTQKIFHRTWNAPWVVNEALEQAGGMDLPTEMVSWGCPAAYFRGTLPSHTMRKGLASFGKETPTAEPHRLNFFGVFGPEVYATLGKP